MKDLSDIIAEGLYQGLLRFEQYLAKEKGSSVATFMAPAPAEKLEVVSVAPPAEDGYPGPLRILTVDNTSDVVSLSELADEGFDMGGAVPTPKKTRKPKATVKDTIRAVAKAVAQRIKEEEASVVEDLEPVVEELEPEAEEPEPMAEEPVVEAAPADHAAFMGRVFGLVREHKNGPEAGSSLAMALIKNKFGLEKFKLAKPEQFVAILTALKEAL